MKVDQVGAALTGHPGFILNVGTQGTPTTTSEMFYNGPPPTPGPRPWRSGNPSAGVSAGPPARASIGRGSVDPLRADEVDVDSPRNSKRLRRRPALNGWDIVEVPAADDRADAVFVEDTVVMFDDLAVIRFPVRRADSRDCACTRRFKASDTRSPGPSRQNARWRSRQVGSTVYVGPGGRMRRASEQLGAHLGARPS
jgi:hypothetical protein